MDNLSPEKKKWVRRALFIGIGLGIVEGLILGFLPGWLAPFVVLLTINPIGFTMLAHVTAWRDWKYGDDGEGVEARARFWARMFFGFVFGFFVALSTHDVFSLII
ncbi:hypothetical protein HYT05_01275 [Candidatus Kaiserbacteria bacterium]|nr:hypothetical protein [Candidatus Kaiserbacteria bacterium]